VKNITGTPMIIIQYIDGIVSNIVFNVLSYMFKDNKYS
jgi:hypothetical protein